MDSRLDLVQLRSFHAFARTGRLTDAAGRLFLTPSAISHAIRKLEELAGVQLTLRRGARLVLSEEGEELARACAQVFNILGEVEERFRQRRSVSGRLRLGAPVEFGGSILMEHLQPFVLAHPELRLDFHLGTDLLARLLADDIDLAIDCHSHFHPELRRTQLFRETYAVVCSPAFRNRHRLCTPADLSSCQVLSCDEAGTWWHRFLAVLPDEHRPELRQVMAINHIRAMINAAVHDLGAALVPEYCILDELARGSLVNPFPDLGPEADHFCLYQKQAKAGREKHVLLSDFLQASTPMQFRRS